MDATLAEAHERIVRAQSPEDLFKELTVLLPPRLLAEHLAPEMKALRTVVDERQYSDHDNKEAARFASGRLEMLYNDALLRAERGLYAPDEMVGTFPEQGKVITIDSVRYAIGEKSHVGAHATYYRGARECDRGAMEVRFHLANTPSDNSFIQNEIRMLALLHRVDVGYWRNLPFMLARFTAGERVGVVTRYFSGLTLTELRTYALHRNGLDQRHMVWIMDRLLGVMWYYHTLGIVHGSISPDKVRIRPSNHNAFLSGWGHAAYRPAATGERVPSVASVFEAPEIKAQQPVGPWTDIYSLGKTMIWLVGGNPYTNEMPHTVEPKVQQFLLNMVWKNPRIRPCDALQLYEAQNKLKDSLWERRFIHLTLA